MSCWHDTIVRYLASFYGLKAVIILRLRGITIMANGKYFGNLASVAQSMHDVDPCPVTGLSSREQHRLSHNGLRITKEWLVDHSDKVYSFDLVTTGPLTHA